MESPDKKPPVRGQVKIHVPADLEPTYTNFALITHSRSEIVVDFAQIMPQVQQARVTSRMVMTPINAKLLLQALTKHLARFESQHGEIPVPEQNSLADQLFRPPASEEGQEE